MKESQNGFKKTFKNMNIYVTTDREKWGEKGAQYAVCSRDLSLKTSHFIEIFLYFPKKQMYLLSVSFSVKKMLV